MTKYRTVVIPVSVAMLLTIFASASATHAEIYQWEYINPANPSMGKQQNTTLAPDGAGVSALPGVNLSNRNLTKAYLIGANLSPYIVYYYDEYGNAYEDSYIYSDLTSANLSQAELTNANLSSATLNSANLSQVNLTNANVTAASLVGANLTGSEVRGATFTGNTAFQQGGISLEQLYSTASYQAHDLTGIGLQSNELTGAHFEGQNLTNARFAQAFLSGANFSQANATNAGFYSADLTGATLSQANLTNADLRGAKLANANLNQANLTDANLSFDSPVGAVDLTGADLSQANLTNANLWAAKLSGANLTGADVRGTLFYPYSDGVSFSGGLTLPQLYSTASYQAHDLRGIVLYDHDLTGVNLAGQNLIGATLGLAKLAGADFTGALVRGAELSGTTYHGFTKEQLYSTASYQAHDLRGVALGSNDLPGIDLAGQDLTNAYLWGTVLTNANLSQANLTNANLTAAVLNGADLRYANLTNAGFDQTQLAGANLSQAILTNANILYTTLTNANLTQANLTNANLTFATLTGANLTGAEVRGASFDGGFSGAGITAAQLYSTASYQAHDLTGIRLDGNSLFGVNLADQNLTNARLGGALENANLSQTNLTNADLGTATITGVNLTGSEVRGATFSGITKAQLYSTASYQAHDLTGITLLSHDLAGVNLAGQNLTNADIRFADLDNADFSQANLTDAIIWAGLTGANFTGTELRGASLSGITANQLYSTASYQAQDLSGIKIYGDLTGVNLTAQNLTNATFENAPLNNANFSHANLTNAVFWFATPVGADFRQANLANATFRFFDLTGADLSGAEVRGASFQREESVSIGLTAAQLYSTASYNSHDLTGIDLRLNDLAGVDLAGQNLTNAWFSGAALANADFSGANLANADFSSPFSTFFDVWTDLTGANLSQTDLTNARFNGAFKGFTVVPGADLTGADLSGSDTRGADFSNSFAWTDPITSNLIHPDGHIAGLDLTTGAMLVVRDYDGNPGGITPSGPLPIRVEEHLTMHATSTLRLVFDVDPWDSTISFAPGIPVALSGMLELAFAPSVDIATQSGRTIDLFDWTGVVPTGTFTISSPYSWNLSQLYTTGEVTLLSFSTLPGDFDQDGEVDGRDFLIWQRGGSPNGINSGDLALWQDHYGTPLIVATTTVPEPSALLLLLFGAIGFLTQVRPTNENEINFTKSIRRIASLGTMLAACGHAGQAHAQLLFLCDWNNPNGGSYASQFNWSSITGIPDSSNEIARYQVNATYSVGIDADYTVGNLAARQQGNVTLAFAPGGTFTPRKIYTTGELSVDPTAGGTVSLSLNDGDVRVSGETHIGRDTSDGQANLIVNSLLTTVGARIGNGAASNGHVTVGPGSTWNGSGPLVLGGLGDAQFDIQASFRTNCFGSLCVSTPAQGIVTNNGVIMADGSLSDVTSTVHGIWNTGDLIVGNAGEASLAVLGTTLFTSQNLNVSSVGMLDSTNVSIGALPGSSGSVDITGNALFGLLSDWDIAGSLMMGGTQSATGGAGRLQIGQLNDVSVGTSLKMWPGSTLSLAKDGIFSISGTANLGGILEFTIPDMTQPQLNDTFHILTASNVMGIFNSTVLPPLSAGLQWDILYNPTNVSLKVVQGLGGDFDNDGDVDGRDFLVWQRGGSPNGTGSGDLALWQAQYGNTLPLTANATAVPEPNSLILIVVCASFACLRCSLNAIVEIRGC